MSVSDILIIICIVVFVFGCKRNEVCGNCPFHENCKRKVCVSEKGKNKK